VPVEETIDVWSDQVPELGQRFHGIHREPRPAPTGGKEHGYHGPLLDVAPVERPTVWPETAADRDTVIARRHQWAESSDRMIRHNDQGLVRGAVGVLLEWLALFPGDTWQQRWIASGVNPIGRDWTNLVHLPHQRVPAMHRIQLLTAAGQLMALNVIRPSYKWLYGFASGRQLDMVRATRDPDGFSRLAVQIAAVPRFSREDQVIVFQQLTRMLIHNGGCLADITVTDCREAYQSQLGYAGQKRTYWYRVLHDAGILGTDAPHSMHAAMLVGQRTVAQLVDGYGVVNPGVRQLLIDYLAERQASVDYTTLAQLASKLVMLFWQDLELHEPGIDSLVLDADVVQRWNDRLRVITRGNRRVGQLREDPNAILLTVRSFYSDINHWAIEDPARWGPWAAPNPIHGRVLIGQNKQKRRATARMHQRVRELAPFLAPLAESADRQRRHAAGLLAAAAGIAPGEPFTHDGETLQRARLRPEIDPEQGGRGRPGVVWADEQGTGKRRNLNLEDDKAFWGWAIIEVLRHTGIRIEELLELTHRSFVAYTLPTSGETIPLLQITPSKTDRERLLVVSPELGEVLTTIIHRVRGDRPSLPLVVRYDAAERLHSPPLPFLLQHRWGLVDITFTPPRAQALIERAQRRSGLVHADGTPIHFTCHDFRRVFATEAVAAGLPVHIAAKLLGHENLNTTQGYVAIYDQDVIEHHRAFIARRRTQRPSAEYRDVTDSEWDEFLAHFEKRKVELGTCGRAYATPCAHEHACIRCPLLRPDPNQIERLTEIRANIIARIDEAHDRGWHGEVEGLETSLAAADQKLDYMRRHQHHHQSMPVGVAAPTRKARP
jgi:hypothetical protein